MKKIKNTQFRYGVEFLKSNGETGRAILTLNKDIKESTELELCKLLPFQDAKIISYKKLGDSEVIF